MNLRAVARRGRRIARSLNLPRWEVLLHGAIAVSAAKAWRRELRRFMDLEADRLIYGDGTAKPLSLLAEIDEDQVELTDDELAPCCDCWCQNDGGMSECFCATCPRGCGACTCCCDCPEPYEL